MKDLEAKIKAYADELWPGRDIKRLAKQLSEEFGELMKAVEQGDETGLRVEAALMTALLMDMLALKGDSLTEWVKIELGIMERRLEDFRSRGIQGTGKDAGSNAERN